MQPGTNHTHFGNKSHQTLNRSRVGPDSDNGRFSSVVPEGPTGANEDATESPGPTDDERSEDEEFATRINGGRGRYHHTAP